MEDQVWYYNPLILFERPLEVFPIKWNTLKTKESKFNSIIRLVIVIAVILLIASARDKGMIVILLIIILAISAVIWESNIMNIKNKFEGFDPEITPIPDPVHSQQIKTGPSIPGPTGTGPVIPDSHYPVDRKYLKMQSTGDLIAHELKRGYERNFELDTIPPFGPVRSVHDFFNNQYGRGDAISELWQKGQHFNHEKMARKIKSFYPPMQPGEKMNLARVI